MPLLATQGLRKHFGETHAVDGVDFSIEEKQLVSLVGSNGAGNLRNLLPAAQIIMNRRRH